MGHLCIKGIVTSEEEKEALGWLASLRIPINVKELDSRNGVFIAPFTSENGREIWKRSQTLYAGPGLVVEEEEVPDEYASVFGVVIEGIGGDLGLIDKVTLTEGFQEGEEKKIILGSHLSMLPISDTTAEVKGVKWLLSLRSMDEVRKILNYPGTVIVNQVYVEFSLYYKSEDRKLTVMAFGIPRNCARETIYQAIRQATGGFPICVDMKKRKDGGKYAFIHTASEKQKAMLIEKGYFSIPSGARIKIEEKKTEDQRMAELRKQQQEAEGRKSVREEKARQMEKWKREAEQKRRETEDRERKLRENQPAREAEMHKRQEEIRRRMEEARQQKK